MSECYPTWIDPFEPIFLCLSAAGHVVAGKGHGEAATCHILIVNRAQTKDNYGVSSCIVVSDE
jgi:hypothetical protein